MQILGLNKLKFFEMLKYYNKKMAAFSIIEVTIAVAVLALVFAGMLAVFHQGAAAAKKTQQQAVAYNVARAALEEYSSWADLDGLDGITDGVVTNNSYARAAVTLNNIIYTPTVTIAAGPVPLTPGLRQITVIISWMDGITARTISVSALKANY